MRQSTGPDFSEIADMLADEIEGVIDDLKIDGKRRGRSFVAFCPWTNHHEPKLYIDLKHKPGKFIDFVGGEQGDALDLVARTLCSGRADRAAKGEAMAWARKFLRLEGEISAEEMQQRAQQAADRRKARDAMFARELAEQRKIAKSLWLHALPLTADDAAGLYLRARGIDLRLLPRLPRAVRFSPEQRWYDDETREIGHVGPALMSAMTLTDGTFASLHRIWINPERPGEKADLKPARKMWPASEAAAIRLWRGETGLSEKDAEKAGQIEDVILCEGVEDGLSIALMTPEFRVHAVGSLSGLGSYMPSKVARRLIVAADNDWGKPQAEAQLDRACARLRVDFGKRVAIARSPEGKDFNDLLRGREA